ncbi:hypothetical protein BLA60_24470 [Actinophytocola xinjiangensis]|uniref:PknH-like protein n=1 Tax=Actinophytocola xinjiangensis TaxID=485602 RepID=A0A7Z0WIU6_9PSEU|nr:hypothetical protein [Actinophytocola xinjiangensis]OLF08029.1 hypothetical protein BLA60_24470 [Actinophytocola xinjiangensis]
MKFLCALVFCVVAAGCSAGCSAPPAADDPAGVAPPATISTYASTEAPAPPAEVARANRDVARAAVPARVPGFTPAGAGEAVLRLCPSLSRVVPADLVHAFGVWSGTGRDAGRSLAVTAVLDPENAPADQLLATLLPSDCPAQVDGVHYVFDRQPIERSDGWTGVLNTILATDQATGERSYEAAYLLSKGDALLNVVAGRAGRATFDPSVDQTAADTVERAIAAFAV